MNAITMTAAVWLALLAGRTRRVLRFIGAWLAAALVFGLSTASLPASAQTACTPAEGYQYCLRFNYTGAHQTWTVPANVSEVRALVWGAGGGGGNLNVTSAGGAGGGFGGGKIAVSPGQTLGITVGRGGRNYSFIGDSAFPGGGTAGQLDPEYLCNSSGGCMGGQGGGYSAIWNGPQSLYSPFILAGGGGGAAAAGQTTNGAGGGGGAGLNGGGWSSGAGGGGGTQTSGGRAGGGSNCAAAVSVYATAGSAYQGGSGMGRVYGGSSPINFQGGGGGGGGYRGGGGGAANCTGGALDGGGGGGSGYVDTVRVHTVSADTGSSASSNLGGAGGQVAGTSASYRNGAGDGGETSNVDTLQAADGAIVLMYTVMDGFYWDGSGSINNGSISGGSGTWDAHSGLFIFNWTNSAGSFNTTWGDGATIARFGTTGGTVTVPGTRTVGGLVFTAAGYTFSGSGAINLAQDATFTLPGSGYTTLNIPIQGSYGLTVNGGGTLTLNALQSTHTGGTTVQNANLDLYAAAGVCASRSPLGTGPVTFKSGGSAWANFDNQFGCPYSGTAAVSSITLETGGFLNASTAASQQLPALTLAGGELRSGWTPTGTGATSGIYVLSGDVNVTADSTINAGNVNNVKPGGVTYNIASGKNLYIYGYFGKGSSLPDTGFTLTGGGVMKVIGTHTASGPITVLNGSLRLGDGTASGDVSSHASISLNGTNAKLVFVRTDSHTVAPPISGTGSVGQYGNGTVTLTGANSYTGDTIVSTGALAYGTAGSVPAASFVNVDAGATLNLNSKTGISRTANTTVNGTLAMGSGASMTLGAGTHRVSNVTGTGTITVNTGATLTLASSFTNTGLGIVLAGGTLRVEAGVTVSLGGITQSAASTIDLSSAGNATLRTANLNPAGFALNVTNWTAASDRLFATAVAGAPARITSNIAPLNLISMGGQPASNTYWSSADEILVAISGTYWDTTANNGAVDGGSGAWDGLAFNWTLAGGVSNGLWAGGTSTAYFNGTAGTVTVSGAQSLGGLSFGTAGYLLSGTGSLALAQDATLSFPSGNSTVGVPITGAYKLTVAGVGDLVFASPQNTYTGGTTIASGTLNLTAAAGSCTGRTPVGTGPVLMTGGWLWLADDNQFGCPYGGTAAAASFTLNAGATSLASASTTQQLPPLTLSGGNLGSSGVVTGNAATWGLYLISSDVNVTANSTISAANVNNVKAGGVGYNVAAGAVLTVSGYFGKGSSLADTGFTLTGGGRMVFNGAGGSPNTATGPITVANGQLDIGDSGTSGSLATHASVTLSGASGRLVFNRSNAYAFPVPISGVGWIGQYGTGTTTLSAANTYSGQTKVAFGTLVYGVAGAVPAGSVVDVDAGASLGLNSLTGVSRSANTTVNGTLALGTNAALTLSSGTHSMAAITGSGTLTVNSGATLTLPASFTNTGVNIVLAGGTLNIGAGASVSLGTLSQTAASTLDFSSSGNASLTVATLNPGSFALAVTQWTAGSDRFYAAAVTGAPARNTLGLAPLNQITLGSNAAGLTYWASGTPGELLASTAAVTYWDPNGATAGVNGGSGTWDSGTRNWTDAGATLRSAWPGGSGTAFFQGTAATVTVSGTQSIGGLNFGSSGYLLTGGTALALAQATSITTPAGGSASIATPLSGPFGITLSGGTTTLSGANTYTGATLISSGTLVAASASALGSGAGGVTVAAGGRLVLSGVSIASGALSLDGSGPGGTGALASSTASSTYGGPITLAGPATVSAPAAAPLTLGAAVTLGGHTLTLAADSAVTAQGALSGAGGLNHAGAGTVTLAAANSYTGSTSVSGGGVLVVSGSTAAGSAVSIGAGSTLAGNGTLAGSVLVSGALRPSAASGAAATVGTLSTGALTLGSTATASFDLAAPGTVGGGVNDLVQVSGNLTLGGSLNISNLAGFSATGSYTLFTYTGTRSGTFASHNLAAIGYQGVLQYDDANKRVLLVAIPRVRLLQVSNAGTGAFNFVMSGLDTPTTVLTTSAAGIAVTSASFSGTAGTAVTLTQTPPSDWPSTPVSISCIDANGASNGNGTGALGSVSGAAITLSAAQVRAGADISCTFTNARNSISGVVFNDGGAPSAGVNTGTPNDGLRNGSEGGLAGVSVRLTNCGATTHASATTDAGGAFSLSVPTAQAGQAVCVVAGSLAGHAATGANAAGTVLADGAPVTVGGIAFTYARAGQQVSFAAPASGQVVLNFGQVKPSVLTPASSARQAVPNSRAVHAHTFTAGTGGSLQVSLGAGTSIPAALTGWSPVAYLDPGCTGTVQLNATRLFPSGSAITVTQDQVVCFVVQDQVPPQAAPGNSHAVPVSATLTFTNAAPALSASAGATDTTTASNAAVQLTKEVRNITQGGSFGTVNQARSGDVLEYRISYTNATTTAVTVLVINDSTPTYTTFQSADAGTLPSGLGSCTKVTPANVAPAAPVACSAAQVAGGTGVVSWRFSGTLAAGASGHVVYQVKVD